MNVHGVCLDNKPLKRSEAVKPHDRSGNWIIRQHLAKVWTHIQFYKYEPSKPSKTDFLRLSTENQTSWIEANDPEYEAKLYGDNYLGCSYNLDEDTSETVSRMS